MANFFDQFDAAPKSGNFFDQFDAKPVAPKEESGFLRQVADVPLSVGRGALTGVRLVADAFGAGSGVSETIKGAEGYLAGLMSAQAKNDEQEIARIMKDAEDKGVGEQVKAAFQAFATAPVDLISQGLGTAAPAIVGLLGGKVLGAGALGARAIGMGVGAGMGAGTAKSAIYEATKEELLKAGLPEDQAEERAQLAQSYGGKNLDQILLSTGLGAFASGTGLESSIKNILFKSGAQDVAKKGALQTAKTLTGKAAMEAVPEVAQGSQEQLAQNIALQREGFDVPTMRGVAGAGALEGFAGAGLGAAGGAFEMGARGQARAEAERILKEEAEAKRVADEAAAEPAIPPAQEQVKGREMFSDVEVGPKAIPAQEEALFEPTSVGESPATSVQLEPEVAQEEAVKPPLQPQEPQPKKPTLQELIRGQEQATEYDTPEQRLREAEVFSQDLTGLLGDEVESYGRAALKNRSLTQKYADMKDAWPAASDAARIAFANNNYEAFKPYENYFKKSAKLLQAEIKKNADLAKADQDALVEMENRPPLAEQMEGVPSPLLLEVEEEVGKLTKDQQDAIAEREKLEKRTAGTSLVQVLKGTLNDNELSELGGRARVVGKNQFLNLKAPKGRPGASMEDMVNSGKLDIFLPDKMRPDYPDYVNSESAEYIRDKLRNNQFYTYETELSIRQINQDVESIERRIQELLSDDDINKEIQYAADEQREIDQNIEEPAAKFSDGTPEQRQTKTADDELDRRQAQLDREAELNQREARLLEERKRLEEERLKLESPTKDQVVEEEERKAKAPELDEREQVRKESEAGAGQFELTREEGRQDTTGDIFNQPEPASAPEPEATQISTKEERKTALAQFKKSLLTLIPPFRSRGGDNRVTVIKPTALNAPLMTEVYKLASEAIDLGLPPATLGNINAAGGTRSKAIAMVTNNGWLMIGSQWKTSSPAEKLLAVIHEIGHVVDAEGGLISDGAKWDAAHTELKDWYRSSANKIKHPLAYPFAPQYKGQVRIKAESFAQAFGYYFTSPVDLQTNAPEAYSQIQSIVERIQNESQRARAAGATKTGTAGIKVQPSRTTEGAAVQPEAGTERTDVSAATRLEDRGAGEVTDTPAFKRWFGDSKVVDESGGPLVVYHGTKAFEEYGDTEGEAIRQFAGMPNWFAEEPYTANAYAGAEGTMYPVYLSIKNPLTITNFDMNDDAKAAYALARRLGVDIPSLYLPDDAKAYNVVSTTQFVEAAQAAGFDGIKVKEGDYNTYAAFEPTQIKSATGNIGTFDPEVQDINAMQANPTRQNIFGEPVLGKWSITVDPKMELQDGLIYKLLDKNIDVKRIVEAVKKTGKEIASQWNPYLQEELYHGRTANAALEFQDKEWLPLLKDMEAKGVTIGELEKYLHNRHAEDYNKLVAKRNPNRPEMQDGGSGITTEAARKYLADLDSETKAKYDELAARVDGITKGTRQLLKDTGYEKAERIEAWEKAFPNYVPLMREEGDFDYNFGSFGTGRGFDVRRDFSRSAMGSKRNVVDIIGNVIAARNNAIALTEKNRVAQAVYGLALEAPNPDFWMAINPDAEKVPEDAIDELRAMGLDEEAADYLMKEPKQRVLDPKRDQIVSRINTKLRENDFVLATRINGEKRYVFFNPKDPRAKRAATALKNLDAQDLGTALGMVAKVTRWMAAVNTQYNPIFGPYNFLRDMQAAALQLSTTELAGQQKEVAANVVPSLKVIYSSLRKRRKGEKVDGEMADLWKEFQKEGGQTGFRDNFSRTQDRTEALLNEMSKITEGKAKAGARAVFDWLSDYNDSLENAVRLSAYKVAKEKFKKEGFSDSEVKQKAASLAKNLTVNFNRKGDIATQMGALYAFFNAAMQGTARMIETLKGPTGKKIMAGGLLLGSMQAALMAAAGFDDEEPPEFVRSKNIVIPTGDGNYIAFPMPLGFHVIPGFSRILTEWTLSGFDDTARRVTDLTGLFLDAFNPVGNAGWSVQTVTPTFLDPFVALGENRDWTGKPISKEDIFSLRPTPGYTRAREGANWLSTNLAEFLNYASGGTKYQPGVLSPTPEQIEYLFGQATGGVGREFVKLTTSIDKTITGEDLPPYKIPLYGRFVGETKSSAAESNKFYKNMEKLNRLDLEIKGRREDREPVGNFMRENPETRLLPLANKTYKDVQALRKRRAALLERDAPRESIQAVERMITRKMQVLNDRIKAMEQ
jgi:hypothetical protein